MVDPAMNGALSQLDQNGFVILRDLIPDDLRRDLLRRCEELFRLEGDRAGLEFKQEPGSRRLANLMGKGRVFESVLANRDVLQLVESVLGSDFKLSSLNARCVNAHNAVVQPLHADMAAIPDERGFWVCNSVWMLTDFTPANGPTRVIPGSHRWGRLPQDELHDAVATHPDEVTITGKAGTVAVINAHAWHSGLANTTSQPRTALHAFFTRSDQPQQQYQKQLISESIQNGFSPAIRKLLALDDPENDRLSSGSVVRSGFLK